MITIDKNIPMPTKQDRRTKYPWTSLKPGESFLMSKGPITSQSRGLACTNVRRANEVYHGQFEAHATKDGMRVWRVK